MKVLITSRSFGRYDESVFPFLRSHGFECVHLEAAAVTPQVIAEKIGDARVLIVGNDTVNGMVLDKAEQLELIHMHGTGLDGIDIEAATERGVLVANVPGANRNAVAEMTLGLMISAGRRICEHTGILSRGEWNRTAGHEISGSTVGIVGTGNIGRRVAELLRGFQTRIVAYDPAPDDEWARENGVEMIAGTDELFRISDWVILNAPLTEGTRNLVNERTLAMMKPTAFVINTSRGGIVDEDALTAALRDRRIAGAAIDAFRNEPLPMDSPLRDTSAVLTPHIAATSVQTSALVSRKVAENVKAIIVDGRSDLAVNGASCSTAS